MRADRLVATLLLIQARGRVTAAEVTAECEVSVTTARRDLEALSAAAGSEGRVAVTVRGPSSGLWPRYWREVAGPA